MSMWMLMVACAALDIHPMPDNGYFKVPVEPPEVHNLVIGSRKTSVICETEVWSYSVKRPLETINGKTTYCVCRMSPLFPEFGTLPGFEECSVGTPANFKRDHDAKESFHFLQTWNKATRYSPTMLDPDGFCWLYAGEDSRGPCVTLYPTSVLESVGGPGYYYGNKYVPDSLPGLTAYPSTVSHLKIKKSFEKKRDRV